MCQLLAVDGLVSMCRVCAQRQAVLLNLFSMWLGLAIAASPPRTPLSEMHLFCCISDACAVGAMWWHSLQLDDDLYLWLPGGMALLSAPVALFSCAHMHHPCRREWS